MPGHWRSYQTCFPFLRLISVFALACRLCGQKEHHPDLYIPPLPPCTVQCLLPDGADNDDTSGNYDYSADHADGDYSYILTLSP